MKVGALDVLHHDEIRAVDPAQVENLHDVLVVEQNRELCLVDQHRDELFVLRVLRMNQLERDRLLEATHALGRRDKHFGHAPRRQPANELVGTKRLRKCFCLIHGGSLGSL